MTMQDLELLKKLQKTKFTIFFIPNDFPLSPSKFPLLSYYLLDYAKLSFNRLA